MNSKVYKWCAVPLCKNTTKATPNKLFVYVPNKESIRKKWLKLARRNPTDVVTNSPIYFCEDHFDLPNDMENYMQYHLMGSVSQVRMKPGCTPKKFACQPDRDTIASDSNEQLYLCKKRKRVAIDYCEKDLEENSVVADHLNIEENASGSLDPSTSNVTHDAVPAMPSAIIAAPKSKAQKQREYRQRIAASRTPAEVITARAAETDRKRYYRLRVAADPALVDGSLQSTAPSSTNRLALAAQPSSTDAVETQQAESNLNTTCEVSIKVEINDDEDVRFKSNLLDDEFGGVTSRKMNAKELNSLCQACLSVDRQLRPISEVLTLIEEAQLTEISPKVGFICWECTAMLRNVARFREKVKQAQDYLKGVKKKNQSYPTLSTLQKTETKLDYDDIYVHNEIELGHAQIKIEFEECNIKQEIEDWPHQEDDEKGDSSDNEEMMVHQNTIGLNVQNGVESYVQLYPLREPKPESGIPSIHLVPQPTTSTNEYEEIAETCSQNNYTNLPEYRIKSTENGRYFVFTRLFAFKLWYEKNHCRKDERIHHVVRALRNCLSDEDKLKINNDELVYKVNSLCTRMNRHLNKTRKYKDRFLMKYTNWLKEVETVVFNC